MLHLHQWEPRSAQRVDVGTVWTPEEALPPATLILYVCKKCGNSKTERRKGYWSNNELRIGD